MLHQSEAAFTKKAPVSVPFCGAKDGVRTRDLDLGKVALYQLSYFRIINFACQSANCGCKGRRFLTLVKSSAQKNLIKFYLNSPKN